MSWVEWWSQAKRSPRTIPLLSALGVLVVLLFAWWWTIQWYQGQLVREQRADAAVQTSLRANTLSLAVGRRIARLQGLHAFVQTSQLAQPAGPWFEFEAFAAELYAGSKGIRSLAVAPGGVVRYVYPLVGNEVAIGYESAKDTRPEVRADVEQAISSSQIVLSGPSDLIQGGMGLIARQAVYRTGDYWGLVDIAVDLPALLAEADLDVSAEELTYALRDDVGRVFFGLSEVFARDPVVSSVELPEGVWELAAVPAEGWEAAVAPSLQLLQVTGLVIVALLVALTYLTVNRQVQLTTAVRQRTEELAQANTLLEQRVERRSRQLAEHARRLAIMEERQRIARELHDSVSQALYGIGLGARTAHTLLEESSPAIDSVDYVLALANAGLAEMRALIFELRPDSLEKEGLVAALGKQAAALEARHKLVVQTELGPEPDIPFDAKEALYRIAQEALNNTVKHANAGRVNVTLQSTGTTVTLEIADDGVGFDPAAEYPGHLGLQSMRERVTRLDGRLQIESAPGRGTRVSVQLSQD